MPSLIKSGVVSKCMELVQLHNPKKDFESVEDKIKINIFNIIDSGLYLNSKYVYQFESMFSDYIGTKYCCGVANGTDAIQICLAACGVAAGDEVITVANAGGYSSSAISRLGAIPIYVDVDDHCLIKPEMINLSLTNKTKAIVITHLYGQCVDVEKIKKNLPSNIKIIEDCAQSHGSEINGVKAGSIGDCSAFSFYPTKNLGSNGDAGAVCTSSYEIAENVRRLRQYGWIDRFISSNKNGINSRMDEFQAACLVEKLQLLDNNNTKRRILNEIYQNSLPKLSWVGDINNSIFHLSVLRVGDREKFCQHMREMGVSTAVHYPVPDYLQPAWYNDKIYLKNTSSCCDEVVSIPGHPSLETYQVKRILTALRDYDRICT